MGDGAERPRPHRLDGGRAPAGGATENSRKFVIKMSAALDALALPDPSGRFEDFFDVVKPGNLLFPFLRRRVEGRALRAMAPAASLELCRTVAEAVVPRRWPREVRHCCECLIVLIVLIVVLRCFLTGARRVGSHCGFAGHPTWPIQLPRWPGLDPRRCLSPRGGPR